MVTTSQKLQAALRDVVAETLRGIEISEINNALDVHAICPIYASLETTDVKVDQDVKSFVRHVSSMKTDELRVLCGTFTNKATVVLEAFIPALEAHREVLEAHLRCGFLTGIYSHIRKMTVSSKKFLELCLYRRSSSHGIGTLDVVIDIIANNISTSLLHTIVLHKNWRMLFQQANLTLVPAPIYDRLPDPNAVSTSTSPTSTTILVVSVSVVVVMALVGGYFFLRRRKAIKE